MRSDKIFSQIRNLEKELKKRGGQNSVIQWRENGSNFGLPALDIPQALGGKGYSCRKMAAIFRIFGEINLVLRDVPGAGHGRMLLPPGENKYISEDKAEIIKGIVSGKFFFAVAITEDSEGSNLHGIKTTAKRTGRGFEIKGKKKYVARLKEASHVIVFSKIEPSRDELTPFLVPLPHADIKVDLLDSMGLNEMSFGKAHFKEVSVTKGQMVGAQNGGMEIFSEHFTYWRAAMAAAAIGCACGSLKQILLWLNTRVCFSGPIGRFTHLQQQLAQHTSRLHMAWLLVEETMDRLDSGKSGFIHASMCKAEALESSVSAADWAMQTMGALGYTKEVDLEKRLRDLMGLRIADGTTDVLRSQVARSLLGDKIYESSLGRKRANRGFHPSYVGDFLGSDGWSA